MPGVVLLAWALTPLLLQGTPPPAPLWVLALVSAVQNALLLAAAVWLGVLLAPRLGLHAPMFEALAASQPAWPALRAQLPAGVAGGVAGALLLWVLSSFAPEPLAQLETNFSLPMAARVLYGGVTEELMLRWGLMTLIAWLGWRFTQGAVGLPSVAVMWSAIALSALVFGFGHLPAVSAMLGYLSPSIIAYVVVGNAAFGLVAGYLYWRYGLEAAMIGHALTHVLAYLVMR